jgi:hypothetical protein
MGQDEVSEVLPAECDTYPVPVSSLHGSGARINAPEAKRHCAQRNESTFVEVASAIGAGACQHGKPHF